MSPCESIRHQRAGPWRPAAGTLLLVLGMGACGGDGPTEIRFELARFDFESAPWRGHAQRTDRAAHSQRWAGLLEGFSGGVSAWSPLIRLEGARRLDISVWTHLERLDGGELSLRLHRYVQKEPQHPAIPDVPAPIGGRRLLRVKTPEEGWTLHELSTKLGAGRPAQIGWVRIELRLDPETRQPGGRMLFDDVVVVGWKGEG